MLLAPPWFGLTHHGLLGWNPVGCLGALASSPRDWSAAPRWAGSDVARAS